MASDNGDPRQNAGQELKQSRNRTRRISGVRLDLYERPPLPGRPGFLGQVIWYLTNYWVLNTAIPYPSAMKAYLLRLFGARVGRGVVIKPRILIKSPWALRIGDHSWIGEGCWIDNHINVSIGSHCCVSQGAYIFTGNHDYEDPKFRFFAQEIRIEDGAWVGAMAIILPGTVVGEGAVVGCGVRIGGIVPPGSIATHQWGGEPKDALAR